MHRNAFIELENILSLMMESYTAALGLIGESDRELFPKSKVNMFHLWTILSALKKKAGLD